MLTRILICGSRDWTEKSLIYHAISEALKHGAIEIIHGGARGADSIAGQIAETLKIPVRVFPAQWDKYGKAAGFRRNIEMLNQLDQDDMVLAFQLNGSRGTQLTINEARKRGISCFVHNGKEWVR